MDFKSAPEVGFLRGNRTRGLMLSVMGIPITASAAAAACRWSCVGRENPYIACARGDEQSRTRCVNLLLVIRAHLARKPLDSGGSS